MKEEEVKLKVGEVKKVVGGGGVYKVHLLAVSLCKNLLTGSIM